MNPQISVIVPVYKAEKYLHRCVDSILAQTFTDFEVLLIDDGSPDRSGEICDEYAKKDSRVRVFHKENGGVSSARNMGLDNAVSNWITFVDSDDWLDCSTLFICSQYLQDYDIIRFSATFIFDKLGKIKKIQKHKEYITKKSYVYDLLNRSVPLIGAAGGLYRKDKIDEFNIRFINDISNGEDWFFVCEYTILCANSVKTINVPLYNYDLSNDFSCTNTLSVKKYFESVYIFKKIETLLRLKGLYLDIIEYARIAIILDALLVFVKLNLSCKDLLYYRKKLFDEIPYPKITSIIKSNISLFHKLIICSIYFRYSFIATCIMLEIIYAKMFQFKNR